MAKFVLSNKVWKGRLERVTDGWLIRISNKGQTASSFFLDYVEFELPKGKIDLASTALVELLSESTANPGGEVIFKLTVPRENWLDMVGGKLTIGYGIGSDRSYGCLILTLK